MLLFTVANERQKKQYQHRDGPMEFGRLQQGQCARIVVEDPYTSRDQLRVEEVADPDRSFWPWYRDSLREFGMELSEDVLDQMVKRTREVFPGCPETRQGMLWSNEQPGLGIDLDETQAARYPFPEHPLNGAWPPVRRLDGTVIRP